MMLLVRRQITWLMHWMSNLRVKGFWLMGAGLRSLWAQTAFIAWPHPFCVCLSDLGPEDMTVHSCALPNPWWPAVCHTLTIKPSSLTLFQVVVLLIWSQITSCTILKLSLRDQTKTWIRKTYCSKMLCSIFIFQKCLLTILHYIPTRAQLLILKLVTLPLLSIM